MEPIEFKGQTHILNKNNEDGFRPLPVFNNGQFTICCWELNDADIEWIVANRKIWSKTMSGPQTVPQLLMAHDLEFRQSWEGAVVWYQEELPGRKKGRTVPVWCAVDMEALPEMVMIDGALYTLFEKWATKYDHQYPLDLGAVYLRNPTPEEAERRGRALQEQYDRMPHTPEMNAGNIREKLFQNSFRTPVFVRKLQAGKEEILG